MSACYHPARVRTRLGCPVISVNHSRRYLRQRIVARQERRTQQDRKWRRRVWVAGIVIALYLLIGRDLLGMARAAGQAASSTVRKDVQSVAVVLKKAAQAKVKERNPSLPPPPTADPGGRRTSDDADAPTEL